MCGVDGSAGVARCLQGGRRYRTPLELNPGQSSLCSKLPKVKSVSHCAGALRRHFEKPNV